MKDAAVYAIFAFLILVLGIPRTVHSDQELLIGLMPEENIFAQMDRYRPLGVYLSKKTGLKIKFTILSKYGDVIDKFASRNMDGAFVEAFTAVLAMEKLAVEPLVTLVSDDGSATIRSYVFVRRDSGIKTAGDMRRKRMAFVDKATVTGYLFAVAWLRENGIHYDMAHFFREFYFTGSHDSAIYSVLDNRADVGTADSEVYRRMLAKDPLIGEELNIIARSKPFPGTTLCVKKDMSGEVKSRLKSLLIGMDKGAEGIQILKNMRLLRFIEAKEKDFDSFSDVARKSGVRIKTYQYK